MSARIEESLLTLAGGRLRRVASTKGGEYAGPCPFCGGTDRLRVWPNHKSGRWWCRQCGKSGDAIGLLAELGEITPQEAGQLRRSQGSSPRLNASHPVTSQRHKCLAPPDDRWQKAARAFVGWAQEQLDKNSAALAWLMDRGLAEETIHAAGLGWNPRDLHREAGRWGLAGGRPVWLPMGWVIPWAIGGALWRINIRRPEGDPKYVGPRGSSNALYNADALSPYKPAVLFEGEIDALTMRQAAEDLVSPVATGSTAGARRPRWIAALAACPVVLVSYDADQAGERAAAWWLRVLPNARRWRPFWQDVNAMAQAGMDLRGWVQAALTPPVQVMPETLRPRVTTAACDQEPGGQILMPQPWEGQLVSLDDLPGFLAHWGLVTVGSEWADAAPCPTLYLQSRVGSRTEAGRRRQLASAIGAPHNPWKGVHGEQEDRGVYP